MTLRLVGPVDGPAKSYNAETALTRGYGVIKGANPGGASAVTAAGQQCIGVVAETVAQGAAVNITRIGDQVGIAGAAIPYQSYVKLDATGRFIPITGTPGEMVCGRAESPAVLVNDEFVIFFNPFVF